MLSCSRNAGDLDRRRLQFHGARVPVASTPRPGPLGRRNVTVLGAGKVVLAPAPGTKSMFVRAELTKDAFVVGSGSGADVRVDDASVAPEHAKLEWRGGRLFITDLGSGKGTSFDGNNIMSGVAYIGARRRPPGPGVLPLLSSARRSFPWQDPPAAPAPGSPGAPRPPLLIPRALLCALTASRRPPARLPQWGTTPSSALAGARRRRSRFSSTPRRPPPRTAWTRCSRRRSSRRGGPPFVLPAGGRRARLRHLPGAAAADPPRPAAPRRSRSRAARTRTCSTR